MVQLQRVATSLLGSASRKKGGVCVGICKWSPIGTLDKLLLWNTLDDDAIIKLPNYVSICCSLNNTKINEKHYKLVFSESRVSFNFLLLYFSFLVENPVVKL